MASIEIDIDIWFDECDPDGSKCHGCEETIYLRQWSLVFSVNRERQESSLSLCQSCYEIFEEGGG